MELAVIGYLLHDVLDVEGTIRHCLGGSAAYTSLGAAKLGLSAGIISKVGKDFKYYKELKGIDLSGVSNQEKTTVFFNTYRNGVRTQKVANIGEQIMPKDITKQCLNAKAIHLGPVFNEISLDTMRFLRQNSKAVITLDSQGFLRKEINGVVSPKELDCTLLEYVDAVKISEKDFQNPNLEEMAGKCKIVIVTKGKNGSAVYFDGRKSEIPFFESKLVDKTGSGDVYMAGFIKKFLETKDAKKAALFGSAAASFAVEDFGVRGIKEIGRIDERIAKNPNSKID